jgi:hypothetical protein
MYASGDGPRMRVMSTKNTLLGAAVALLTLGGTAAVPADAAPLSPVRDYDLKLSVSMKSDFSFNVDPTGCNGRKPNGWIGSGQEILEAGSPKPVRVTLMAFKGSDMVLNRKDRKAGYEIVGTTRRTGSMRQQVCDDMLDAKIERCLGEHRIDTKVDPMFMHNDKFQISDTMNQDTRDVIPACGDDAFGWDSAVSRTGVVLLDTGQAPGRKARKTKGSFTLTSTSKDTCDVAYFGTGTCGTEWTWKAKFTPVKKRKRR